GRIVVEQVDQHFDARAPFVAQPRAFGRRLAQRRARSRQGLLRSGQGLRSRLGAGLQEEGGLGGHTRWRGGGVRRRRHPTPRAAPANPPAARRSASLWRSPRPPPLFAFRTLRRTPGGPAAATRADPAGRRGPELSPPPATVRSRTLEQPRPRPSARG